MTSTAVNSRVNKPSTGVPLGRAVRVKFIPVGKQLNIYAQNKGVVSGCFPWAQLGGVSQSSSLK